MKVQPIVGLVFPLGPYTVTREELLAFATGFDPQPFHLDEELGKSSVLGGLAASGWHTASIMMRMLCDAFFVEAEVLGSAGIEEMKWLKPVYAGDVLSGQFAVTEVRASMSGPGRVVVSFHAEVWDQTRQPKATMRSMVFVKAAAA